MSLDNTIPSNAATPAPPTGAHPTRIGSCRIVRLLGQGGMGLVYEAEQLEPLRRIVALKVIRRGMDSREVVSLLMDQRRWAEAEPLALRVLAIRDSLKDTLARKSAAQLVQLYEGWGKMEQAAEYREQAPGGSVPAR